MQKTHFKNFLVRFAWRESVPQHGEDSVRSLPNPDPHPAPEHADRHDGQHLRHCHRKVGEGVSKTSQFIVTENKRKIDISVQLHIMDTYIKLSAN